jgi:hypothetical protein
VLEQIEGQRARRNEKHPDPDGPMRKPVSHLVPVPEFALARQFYFYSRIHVDGFLVRKQLSFYNLEGARGNFSVTFRNLDTE